MIRARFLSFALGCLAIGLIWCPAVPAIRAAQPPTTTEAAFRETPVPAAEVLRSNPKHLTVTVDKSLVLETPAGAQRVSVASGDVAEAVVVSPNEVLINGKGPGTTSLVVWDVSGHRSIFDVQVTPSRTRLDAVRAELQRELPGQPIEIHQEGADVFLSGTAADLVSADRAAALATVLGKVVNLLHVAVPKSEPQVLLRVRFANVDRTASLDLGANLFSLNQKGIGASSTGQFGSQPVFNTSQQPTTATLNQLLNIFVYRPDLNIGAVIQALETKQLAQILAEPNLLTISGHQASFLAGGQFPYPTLQGGANGIGQITIQFRDFGIRLNFRPTVTVRGTIQLEVEPEVSSLDPANGLTISGYTVPGLDTRRVQTEVELADGQSFVIAGLLDNRLTETINKIPGLSSLPVFGKMFQSRSVLKNNSELLVIVTPEIVQPMDAGEKAPEIQMPMPFLGVNAEDKVRQPRSAHPERPVPPESVPIEVLEPPVTQDPNSAAPASSPGSRPSTMTPSTMTPASMTPPTMAPTPSNSSAPASPSRP